jgi:hypothetical protein
MESASPQYLFFGLRLNEMFSAVAARAASQLAEWPADDLLSSGEADIADRLIGQATIELPSLARGKAWLAPPGEVTLHSEPYAGPWATVTRYTLVVPVTGDPSLFGMSPGFFTTATIRGEIDHTGMALRLHCDNPKNADQAKAYFDRLLDQIERRLERSRVQIRGHNQKMARQLPAAVAQRRAKLRADRRLGASIGYPIKKRPDADSYSVPVTRRKIVLGRPAIAAERRNAYVPEPAIDDADYEAVLTVLKNARNALERSPSMTAMLGENETRDLLLVSLNAQFEGKAAGEVFNCTGKTDILVREGDRNVFIAECKIYDPNDTHKKGLDFVVTGALNQLLGYLTWRDTKAALLLFIRDANVSTAVEKARAVIGGHPNHLRPGKISTEERHDFVLHANGDTNREIHLAFLPFLIARKQAG